MTDWQIISIVVAIGAPLLILLIQRWAQRKKLSYKILSRTPLLNIQGKNKWDIQILFDKKPVDDVDLIEFEIFNSGHQEIKPNDYEYPISFDFGENTLILSAEKSEVNPVSLQPSIRIEGTKVVLDPILLNPEDSIVIKMLVSRYENKQTPNVRIAGIKDIKDEWESSRNRNIIHSVTGAGICTISLFLLVSSIPSEVPHFLKAFTFFLLYGLIGFFIMIQGFYLYLQERKKSLRV